MALSPVASAGDDAPPMPDDTGQGTGYRIVYSRAMQRVWAVNDAEAVVRSYLVSGSQYRYSGLPRATLEAFEAAPSKGRFFDAHIRERFKTERVR